MELGELKNNISPMKATNIWPNLLILIYAYIIINKYGAVTISQKSMLSYQRNFNCAIAHVTMLKKNIEKHLLPQFVNTIEVICQQNEYKINFYF